MCLANAMRAHCACALIALLWVSGLGVCASPPSHRNALTETRETIESCVPFAFLRAESKGTAPELRGAARAQRVN